MLGGKYLTPPSLLTKDPTLVVQCSSGKFKTAYFDAGAVVQRGSYQSALKGTLAHVDIRFDEKKPTVDSWEISNDGQGLFFDSTQLTRLLTGRMLGHPGDAEALVHRVILGVVEAFGNQIVIEFDMPQEADRMVTACGLEWGRRKKK